VAWVNAGDIGSLLAGLAAVADALGLTGDGTSRDADRAGEAVRHWLETDGYRCLVVFDNVSDPDVVRPFIPAGGPSRVLITSNRQSIADLGVGVSVDVFPPGEALAFLAERTGLADTEGAAALADELGYLPLALAQAAAVIAAQHLSYQTYLDRLRGLPVQEYLTRELGQPSHGVAEAVLLSLEAVRAGDQAGVCSGLMDIMAVLSADGVRRALLHDFGQAGVLVRGAQGTEVSAEVLDDALAQLEERSLLAFSVDGKTVFAHRLILRVVREELARQGHLPVVCRAAAFVLDQCAQVLKGSQDRPAIRDIAEQITALQDNTAALAGEADDELARMLLGLRLWALYYVNELGDSAEKGIALGEPLTADFERLLGADHLETLDSRNNLANAYYAAGRAAEAIKLHERTLVAYERVLGLDDPSTLTSRNNLAISYQAAGRAAMAIPLHEQTLATRERILGSDHPSTLTSRNNVALAYQAAGRTAEAIPLHEHTLATRERILGSDHPDTLTSQSNLANAYYVVGRVAEAIPLHQQTLATRERILGSDHPSTLTSRNNVALAYQAAGRTAEAIPLFEQALSGFERVLGPDHPSTLALQNNPLSSIGRRGALVNVVRTEDKRASVLSDEATLHDDLGRTAFVETLTDVLLEAETPLVVTLYGQWGSGKTSMMMQLQNALTESNSTSSSKVATVWFVPWENSTDKQPGVSLLLAIRRDLHINNVKVNRALRSIALAITDEVHVPYIGLSLGGVRKNYQKLADQDIERRSKQALLRDRFKQVISIAREEGTAKEKKLVVFIDDLDRCQPATAVAVLEALKLYFSLDGCIFVLGLDRQPIEAAIAHEYESLGLAKESYLDKIVQLPFTIPALSQAAVSDYVKARLPRHLSDCQEMLTLAAPDNPRQLKRTINTLLLLDRIAEISFPHRDSRVLCAVALIQNSAPNLYRRLRLKPKDWALVVPAGIESQGSSDWPRWLGGMLKGSDSREALSAVLLLLRKNLASSSTDVVNLQPYIALSEQLGVREPLFRLIDELEGQSSAVKQPEALKQLDQQAAVRISEAIPLYERTLAERENVLGPNHADTLTAQINLADAYKAAGRIEEARDHYEQAAIGMTRVLGADHPNTLAAQGNLANAYQIAGLIEDAIALYQRVVKGMTRVLGPDHPNTLTAQGNLGDAYRAAHRIQEAAALHQRVVEGLTRVLGPDSPTTLAYANSLAAELRELGAA
jgi:tetratricopeptide (TPR) repeat protein